MVRLSNKKLMIAWITLSFFLGEAWAREVMINKNSYLRSSELVEEICFFNPSNNFI